METSTPGNEAQVAEAQVAEAQVAEAQAAEARRLRALREYQIVDTMPEKEFDDLTLLAAQICGTPIALITFLDDSCQWLKSRRGIDIAQTARDLAICNYTIASDEPLFVVSDLSLDARFVDHPFVAGSAGLRFYAGASLRVKDDLAMGAICVIDSQPHQLTEEQGNALQALARQVVSLLELRRTLSEQKKLLEEREATARELRLKQRRFDDFMDNSPVLAYIKDAQGRLTYMNRALAQHFGIDSASWIGKDDFALWPAEIADELRRNDLEVLKSNVAHELVERVPFSNGELREYLSVKFPIENAQGERSVGGMSVDITERRAIENELRQSEKRYRDLVENASDLVYTVSFDERLTYANRAWLRTLGYSLKEAESLKLRDFVHPHDLEKCREFRLRVLDGEKNVSLETTLITRDGQEIEIEGRLSARYVNGVAVAISGIFHDVTKRRKIERMKDEFVSTVSHELRTPLTSIRGALGLLKNGAAGEIPDAALQLLEIAHQNSDRLMRLINDLLDTEKAESGNLQLHLQPLSLATKIRHSLESNRAYGDKFDVQFHFETPHDEAFNAIVNADTDALSRVLANLLSNAAKFSPPGGMVRVSVEATGEHWRVAIHDDGDGIPDEFRARIFQKFAQADSSDTRQRGGTGLGLSISRALLHGMNGHLDFSSEKGAGTTFFFDLPRWDSPPEDDAL